MDSTPALSEFEYTIHDSRGIVGVKNGKEYPVSKADWNKAHPEHKDTGCEECVFVADQKTIFAFNVDRQLRQTVGYDPVFVGKFTMPEWVGHSRFYLFKCKECEEICVDHPHGYRGPYLYLCCDDCGYCLDLNSSKFRAIYEDNGILAPRLLVEEDEGWFKKLFKLFKSITQLNLKA